MNHNLRAAAERLRRANTDGYSTVYKFASEQHAQDSSLLVDAWLAEHPADEDEPVWSGWAGARAFNRGMGVEWDQERLAVVIGMANCRTKTNPTRGDVRRLCRALGVELKENT